jgi:hypothetical protein
MFQSERPNTVCFSYSPEDGIKHSFRNIVLSNYLEFRTMDKAHKQCDVPLKVSAFHHILHVGDKMRMVNVRTDVV